MYSNPFASYAPAQLASPSAPFYNNPYNRPAPVYNPAGPVANNVGQTTILPAQQIIQVNGKAGIDMLRMAPNSSALVMDMTAPIIWVCVSDGVGYVTPTPYDVTPHVDKPEVTAEQVGALDAKYAERLTALENKYAALAERLNANADANEPNADSGKSE